MCCQRTPYFSDSPVFFPPDISVFIKLGMCLYTGEPVQLVPVSTQGGGSVFASVSPAGGSGSVRVCCGPGQGATTKRQHPVG